MSFGWYNDFNEAVCMDQRVWYRRIISISAIQLGKINALSEQDLRMRKERQYKKLVPSLFSVLNHRHHQSHRHMHRHHRGHRHVVRACRRDFFGALV